MFFLKKSFIFYYNVLYLVSIEGYANRRCDIVNSNENSHLIDDINKKHEDASFIREQKKRAKEIEKLKKDRLKLEKDILKKIEKASYEKEKQIEKQQKKNKKKSFFSRLK